MFVLLKSMKFFNNNKKLAYMPYYRRIPYLIADFHVVVSNFRDLCLGIELISPEKIVVSNAEQLLGLVALEKSLGIEVGFGDINQAIELEASNI